MKKIFIDGSAGTTGLRIKERLLLRKDIELIILPEEKRKDEAARRDALNSADIAVLCLPDDAAREAAAFAEKNRLHLCHWFTVGDLSQLRRGGRLSAGKAIVGNLLNIKPVLHVDDEGHLVPMASAKGRKKSIEALVSHMEESAVAPEQQRVYISHGDCLADAQLLAQMVRDRLHVSSVTIGEVGPVIGAHSGAGTLALFFVGTHR